jgi:hypothetical protein
MRNVEGNMQLLARPAIINKWWGDLYFALKDGPEKIDPFTIVNHFNLTQGQTAQADGYKIAFLGFSVPPDVAALVQQGQMPSVFPVTAHLLVTTPDGKITPVDTKFIQYKNDPVEPQSPEILLPKIAGQMPPAVHTGLATLDHPGRMAIGFEGMDADSHQATFYVRDATFKPEAAFTIEISTRPGIGLVWLGTILIALGGLFSMRRRALENRLVPVPEPPSGEPVAEKETRRRTRTAPSRKPVSVTRSSDLPAKPEAISSAPMKGGH